MKRKTKEELINIIEELQNKLEIAENDVDYWQQEYDEMEEIREDLECQLEDLSIKDGIKDLDSFKFELSKENLNSKELINFIDNYVRFKND